VRRRVRIGPCLAEILSPNRPKSSGGPCERIRNQVRTAPLNLGLTPRSLRRHADRPLSAGCFQHDLPHALLRYSTLLYSIKYYGLLPVSPLEVVCTPSQMKPGMHRRFGGPTRSSTPGFASLARYPDGAGRPFVRRGSERLCEPGFGRDHGVGIDLVDWMGLKWLLSRQIVHVSIRI